MTSYNARAEAYAHKLDFRYLRALTFTFPVRAMMSLFH